MKSADYWIDRYRSGGNSGIGSYNELAELKATVINTFVRKNGIVTVLELGCGDGNQLKYAKYPFYIGFDVSPEAITMCRSIFKNDSTKKFKLLSEYEGETAQLTLSLDVIYHLVEDEVFHSHMQQLFNSSEQYVIIYSSDYEDVQRHHERRRQFTKWIDEHARDWKLKRIIPNIFPYDFITGKGSFSDFYIYERIRMDKRSIPDPDYGF